MKFEIEIPGVQDINKLDGVHLSSEAMLISFNSAGINRYQIFKKDPKNNDFRPYEGTEYQLSKDEAWKTFGRLRFKQKSIEERTQILSDPTTGKVSKQKILEYVTGTLGVEQGTNEFYSHYADLCKDYENKLVD